MDRQLAAWLIIAALAIVVAIVIARALYYSRDRVMLRRKRADEARWAARARRRTEEGKAADAAAGPS